MIGKRKGVTLAALIGGGILLAILLHMLMDTFPALYQRGLVPLWAVEVWTAIWVAIVVFIAVKLYGEMKEPYQTERVL